MFEICLCESETSLLEWCGGLCAWQNLFLWAAGTLNSDIPRDLDLPLKERFFIQSLSPAEAAKRAKESAKDILGVKQLIEKKAWPYVQNDLRLKAELLRYDLNTVISAKSKEDKKPLKELTGKLFQVISDVSFPSLASAMFTVFLVCS